MFGIGKDKSTDKMLTIIGEVKTNINISEVKHFIKGLKKAREVLKEVIFPVLFGFLIRLDARELAKENNIRMFVSYGKEIK